MFAAGADDAAALAERVARLIALDYPAEMIDLERAAELEPAVDGRSTSAVAWFPGEGWAHGPTLARTLAEAARALGAEVRTGTRVESIDVRADGVTVGTGGEALSADALVVAAGRFSDRVAALADLRLPLAPTCGLLAVTSPVVDGPRRVSYLPGVHLRPDGDGRLVLQDDETDAQVGPDSPEEPSLPGCRILLERARRYVPALVGASVESARVGIRALPADGYPFVGPAPGRERLYLAVTHSGMTLGPLLGELAAAELLTGAADPRLSTFRPDRLVVPV
jgi:glycine/D-amino acid oxidase-like deaminating enzyme